MQAEASYTSNGAPDAAPNGAHDATAAAFALASGIAAFKAQNFAAAETAFRASVTHDPGRADAWSNLGAALAARGEASEAAYAYRRATDRDPTLATAWINGGLTLARLDRLDEALAWLDRGRALTPDVPAHHLYAAGIARDARHLEHAVACARAALAASDRIGASADARAEVMQEAGQIVFSHGMWREGWALIEEGLALENKEPPFPGPRWRGETIPDRTVLIRCDWGFGDIINFARYAIPARARARIVLSAPPPLRRILRSLPADITIAEDEPVSYNAHALLHTLPRIFDVRADDVRVAAPYLAADPVAVRAWRERLAQLPGLKVGLVWAGGNAGRIYDGRRSMHFDDLRPLLDLPGISFVSLQKEPGSAEARPHARFHDWSGELGDFLDTASLIAALDLVISVDTSVAHLAGALGRPVWMINKICSDGRWPVGPEPVATTPWYPSMRIFRQIASRDWNAPIARIRDELAQADRSLLASLSSEKEV